MAISLNKTSGQNRYMIVQSYTNSTESICFQKHRSKDSSVYPKQPQTNFSTIK